MQQVYRQRFNLEGLGRCKPHGSFPSPALLPQDADETQGEYSKDEGMSGAQTAESQVGWSFLQFFLTCFFVCLFVF